MSTQNTTPKIEISRSQLVAEAWRRGELSWKLRPEQLKLKRELEQSNVQLGVFNISRRFGKTFTLVVYCLEQAQRSKQKIRYGTAFLTDLEEFILPAFHLILEDCPDHLRPVYKATKKLWVFPNGSEIKLVGIDRNPQGLRGNAISKIVIDEAGFVTNLRHVYTSVLIPATAKQADIKLVFISTPPESPDHFFVSLIQKADTQANGYYACLTIDDISDLDPKERARLLQEVGGEQSAAAQREFFCKLVIDSTRSVCPEFDPAVHVKPAKLPSHYRCWIAGDWGGVQDKTVAHLCAYDFERGVVMFVRETAHSNMTGTGEIVAGLRGLEDGFQPARRHIDAPGQTLADLRVEHAYLASLPEKLDFDTGLNGFRLAIQQGRIEIDPSCKMLIQTLQTGMLNKGRTDYLRTEALGHCDALASAIYAYRHKLSDNPYPALFRQNRESHATWNQSDDEIRHKQALNKVFGF